MFDQQTDYKTYFHDVANFCDIEESGFYNVKATAFDQPPHDADVGDIAYFALAFIDKTRGIGQVLAMPNSYSENYWAWRVVMYKYKWTGDDGKQHNWEVRDTLRLG